MLNEACPPWLFTLPDQNGNEVALADFAGRTVVLCSYSAPIRAQVKSSIDLGLS